MKKKLHIIGCGEICDEITYYWRADEPDREITNIDPEALADFLQNDKLLLRQDAFFVALDNDLLNLKRLGFINQLVQEGLKVETFVSRLAVVPPDLKLGFNSYVGPNVIIEPSCRFSFNTFIGVHSHIGSHSTLQHSVWLGKRVTVGQKVNIGNHTVLTDNITIKREVNIGAFTCIEKQMVVHENIAEKTFILEGFQSPLHIIKFSEPSAA